MPYVHCYRHLAIRDLFAGTSILTMTSHTMTELDALEDIGWVEERVQGVYYLTLAGAAAKMAPEPNIGPTPHLPRGFFA